MSSWEIFEHFRVFPRRQAYSSGLGSQKSGSCPASGSGSVALLPAASMISACLAAVNSRKTFAENMGKNMGEKHRLKTVGKYTHPEELR